MVPLRHAVANGDVVEIITQKGHEPSRDWLSFVHTSRARSKIRQWINLHEREQAKDVGKRLLEKEARQADITLKKIPPETWQRVASEYGCGRIDDLYADLGYGKWSARQVLAKASGQPLADPSEEKQPKIVDTVKRMLGMNDGAILVRGHDDLMVYRSKCCNPIPGDDVIGYVTRGRGIAVHSKNCPERPESAVRRRAPHRRRMGGADASYFSGSPAHSHRRSPWDARQHYYGDQRQWREHPHV